MSLEQERKKKIIHALQNRTISAIEAKKLLKGIEGIAVFYETEGKEDKFLKLCEKVGIKLVTMKSKRSI